MIICLGCREAACVIGGLGFGERESPQMEPLLIRALVDAFGFLNFIGSPSPSVFIVVNGIGDAKFSLQ